MFVKLVAFSMSLLVASAGAQASFYSNKATFISNISANKTLTTFDGLVGTPGFDPYTEGGYNNAGGYTLDGVKYNSGGPFFRTFIFDPVSEFSLGGSSSGMFDQFGGIFKLNTPASAFGFDFGSHTGTGNLTINITLLSGQSVSSRLSFTGVGFFGYTGDLAISTVAISDPDNTAFYFKYDNVISGNTVLASPGVPEPASWAMLIGGFGLTGAAMRRRRFATV